MATSSNPKDRTPEDTDAPAEDPRADAAQAPSLDIAGGGAAGAGGAITPRADDAGDEAG